MCPGEQFEQVFNRKTIEIYCFVYFLSFKKSTSGLKTEYYVSGGKYPIELPNNFIVEIVLLSFRTLSRNNLSETVQ